MGILIGKYEFRLRGIVNVEKEKKLEDDQNIIKRIRKITLTRIVKQIKDWQTATLVAESVVNPLNWLLMAVYRDIEIDGHLYALMQTIVLKVLSNNYVWIDKDGNVDEKVTSKFKKKWFRKFTIHAINSDFYGYSLCQMGDFVDGTFNDCVLVPRDYVNQRMRVVQKTLSSAGDGTPYNVPPFNKWVIGIGDVDNLGLLHKAAPLVIKKKEVISAWSEAAEIFGMPLRIGYTNISSPKNRENMENMLDQMGEAMWGVMDKDDKVDLVQGKRTDFYQIYDKFVDRANSELSKLILLQTGTTDEKAFVGSAEVHADVVDDLISAKINFFVEIVNEELKPFCIQHGMLTEDHTFKMLNETKLSMQEMILALTVFLQYYDLPADWITEKFDIPVEDKPTPAPGTGAPIAGKIKPSANPSEVMNQLKAIYEGFGKKKHYK